MKEVHVDADPATVMTLIGPDGDMLAFTGNLITRTNTPGIFRAAAAGASAPMTIAELHRSAEPGSD